MTLQDKLFDIQQSLKVGKAKHNSFGGFDYRSNEDVLVAVKPLLKKHGLVIIQTDEMVAVGTRHYIKATTLIVDSENKKVVSADGWAREPEQKKGMDESQLTGSTSSYARKYSANGLFAIDDNVDSDVTNTEQTPEFSEKQIKDKLEVTTNVRDLMYLYGKLTSDQKIEYQEQFTKRKESLTDGVDV